VAYNLAAGFFLPENTPQDFWNTAFLDFVNFNRFGGPKGSNLRFVIGIFCLGSFARDLSLGGPWDSPGLGEPSAGEVPGEPSEAYDVASPLRY
jgi:hypothetical protein